MLSFRKAYEMGYRHFETDLHITRDGALVCFHDPTLDRTTNGSGLVSDMTLEQLKGLDAAYWHRLNGGFPYRGSGVEVPTLLELLAEFDDVSVIVDLKTDGMAHALARVADEADATGRLVVGSFSDQRLEEFRSASGGVVPTSAGPRTVIEWVAGAGWGRPGRLVDAIQVSPTYNGVRLVDRRLVELAGEHDVAVHVWTVNQEAEMDQLLDLGVDGIITDRPDILRAVLERRGLWPE